MSLDGLYLIAGLGNPGSKYINTRHNAGFMAVDMLSEKHGFPEPRLKFGTLYSRGEILGHDVILAKPQTFMNRSGPALRKLADYFKIQRKALMVIHDEIDLAFRRLKIKEKGGDGGHKGLRSLIEAFGGNDFVRIRLGIGRSIHGNDDVVSHVLSQFRPEEQQSLNEFIQLVCEAIETILCKGIKEGMNRFNQNLC
ncbi:MAG: aminoacyl-tRNA hydrolase [Desulfobacteraceae bacterium]|nr:aminoacyl-tRNA hydrolase [Desulfobacteraceae bacterium]